MKNQNNIMTVLIVLILVLTIIIPLFALPTISGQSTHTKKTYAVIGAMPNPVGVSQEVLLWLGITDQLQTASHGWEGLTISVTKPDNTTQTLGPFRTDSTGSTGTVFIPTMTGTYYLQTHFPAQWYNYSSVNIYYQASSSEKYPLEVQQEPINSYPNLPLPTEYWTRPINSQLREWSSISANWLTPKRAPQFAPYNDDAPETGHVLWTKPLAMGGLAGGDLGDHAFEDGDAYEGLWGTTSPVIIGGVLYYNQYKEAGGTKIEQDVVAVDLHTGEELWVRNWNNTRLSFGQVFYWDSYNYHAAFSYLWSISGTTWNAYEAESGRWIYSMTNVPSGSRVIGPKGEIYIYTVNTARGWMTLWNSSRVVSIEGSWIRNGMGTTFNAANGIEWNKTIPTGLTGSVAQVFFDDMLLGFDQGGTVVRGMVIGDPPFSVWALNIKTGQEGQLLWEKTYASPPGNVTISMGPASTEDRVWTIWCKEHRTNYGYSLDTGSQIWGPTEPQAQLDIFGLSRAYERNIIAYGKLFGIGYAGVIYCYDVKTGELLWDYEAKDPYNEILWSNNWPLYYAFIADNKIYAFHAEHSPVDPKPRGAPTICLDIETGQEVWSMTIRGSHWASYPAIGDSIMVMPNSYDQRIYAIGKGPSATSIIIRNDVIKMGSNVLIQGMVNDISPGTADYALKARFPNGVPVVSDDSMTAWMEYVYMQLPRPTNATGVPVTISVVDANGNYREIGTTTSDADGFFSFNWMPDIDGKYTVYASFEGSAAYWPSHAVSTFIVDTEELTPAPLPDVAVPPTDMYIISGVAAIIVTIGIVGVVLLLAIKKRP